MGMLLHTAGTKLHPRGTPGVAKIAEQQRRDTHRHAMTDTLLEVGTTPTHQHSHAPPHITSATNHAALPGTLV